MMLHPLHKLIHYYAVTSVSCENNWTQICFVRNQCSCPPSLQVSNRGEPSATLRFQAMCVLQAKVGLYRKYIVARCFSFILPGLYLWLETFIDSQLKSLWKGRACCGHSVGCPSLCFFCSPSPFLPLLSCCLL